MSNSKTVTGITFLLMGSAASGLLLGSADSGWVIGRTPSSSNDFPNTEIGIAKEKIEAKPNEIVEEPNTQAISQPKNSKLNPTLQENNDPKKISNPERFDSGLGNSIIFGSGKSPDNKPETSELTQLSEKSKVKEKFTEDQSKPGSFDEGLENSSILEKPKNEVVAESKIGRGLEGSVIFDSSQGYKSKNNQNAFGFPQTSKEKNSDRPAKSQYSDKDSVFDLKDYGNFTISNSLPSFDLSTSVIFSSSTA